MPYTAGMDERGFDTPESLRESRDRWKQHAEFVERRLEQMARAVLSLAEDAGMPDSYKQSDSRMVLARDVLGHG